MRTVFFLLSVVFIASCERGMNVAPAAPASTYVHEWIMKRSTNYRLHSRTKALAICVDWPENKGEPIYVLAAGGSGTSDQSGKEIGTGAIIRAALQNCQGNQARGNHDCTCQIADVGGSNKLEAPTGLNPADHEIENKRRK